MARANRPGKRERQRKALAKQAALRAQIITENMRAHVKAPKPIPCGPQGYERRAGHSSASRDHLKVGTGTVGFYGGRFYSPKDTVTNRENDGGKLAPITRGHTAPKSARFREDDYRTDKPDDKRERRERTDGKWSRWKKV